MHLQGERSAQHRAHEPEIRDAHMRFNLKRMAIRLRVLPPLLALGVLCANPMPTRSQPPARPPTPLGDLPEYVVKAGFLYNFAKYVEWPGSAFDGPDAPISVGVVGSDPFGDELERTLQDKAVNRRGFEIRRYATAEAIERVHILFVPRSEEASVAAILTRVRDRPVLTVGEHAGFPLAGGMIAILIEASRPRLRINVDAAQRHGLRIDSRLLKVASIVGESAAP
jgi:hypothetical protein